MLTDARRKEILRLAEEQGEVVISTLAKKMQVSVETIRRDINALSAQNKLKKVHGGAVCALRPVAESGYEKRKSESPEIKGLLGRKAASLIGKGEVIALSSGSTVETVAACLEEESLTVITGSLAVGQILRGRCDCILLGGKLNPEEGYTYGPLTLAALKGFCVDTAVVSASAADREGLMTTSVDEGDLQQKMMAQASRVILVAESKKFAARSVYRYSGWEGVSDVVTDSLHPLDPTLVKKWKALGIVLHIESI